VHVGLPKTGTSYLQSVVWANLDVLRDQGLVVVPDPTAHPSRAQAGTQVMLAVRDRRVPAHDPETAVEVLDRFAAEVAGAGDADVLLTQEQLAGCTRPQVRTLLERLGDREVHVVVTARAVSRQVPSAWQERVKTRSTTSYADFVAAARDRTAPARGFRRNQDLPAVLARGGESLPGGQEHVVTVPARRDATDTLESRWFGVLGIEHTRLRAEQTRSNSSLGAVQAELLRRVNVALGDRLPKPRLGYARVAKWFLTERFLVPQGGRPPLLPASAERWCRDLARAWEDTVTSQGYAVAGDLTDLLPDPAHFARDVAEPTEGELLAAATTALADLLVHRHDELAHLDALHARLAELEDQRARHQD
jgi:hypothetical protein